jgi:transmembrane protein 18
MEHFHAFRLAITWNEPFILGLLVFQVIMFGLCFYVSRRDRSLAPRIVMLVLIGLVVRSAEYLNQWASQHWEEFATQNYFDKRGVFVAVMVSGPLLLDSFVMLFLFLSEAGSLLVKVKKEEIKRNKKQKKNDQIAVTNNNNQDGRTKTHKQE